MIYSKFFENFTLKIMGASHDEAIYLDIFGLPNGYEIDMEEVCAWLDERKSKLSNKLSTTRLEKDTPLILNKTTQVFTYEKLVMTDDVMSFKVINNSFNSQEYNLKYPRPSHCDLVAHHKYKNMMNLAGGGMFSGRMSLLLVLAGAIAFQILKKEIPTLSIGAKLIGLGNINVEHIDLISPSKTEEIIPSEHSDYINSVISEGDSLGGSVLSYVEGLPIGLGGPLFDSLDSQISKLLFSLPAMKALEFGNGISAKSLKGSKNNDPIISYYDEKIITSKNNEGGINGGMSNSMPLVLTAHFKPTPSIRKEQETINIETGEKHKIQVKGRHDIAFVTRTLPCVKSAVAIALLDKFIDLKHFNESSLETTLDGYRFNIDEIDRKIVNLLHERMEVSKKVGKFKIYQKLEITDFSREELLLSKIPVSFQNIFKEIIKESKNNQK